MEILFGFEFLAPNAKKASVFTLTSRCLPAINSSLQAVSPYSRLANRENPLCTAFINTRQVDPPEY